MITAKELREKYIAFFKEKEHAVIESASLVPENDPTVLFTTAGMHPLVPYLLGEKHPGGTRIVDVQKCVRTGDIDEVGDATHLTFFEMLGNWSLGDYFKQEQIPWSWEFLTSKEWLGIDPERLYVTVYEGDEQVPKDEESIALWKEQFKQVGIDAKEGERIFPLPKEDNWWGPAGQTGPCGPDTEMFFDTHKEACGSDCKPGCSCGKYVEIWNDVFMEYNKTESGSFEKLAQQNVDTGMGVERTVAVLNGFESAYEGDTLQPLIKKISELSDKSYEDAQTSYRIIADHVRAAVLIASDGVVPANAEQGYILRRLIRRAVRHAKQIGIQDMCMESLTQVVLDIYTDVFDSVKNNGENVVRVLVQEEEKFVKTLANGMRKFADLVASERALDQTIDGKDAFDLFQTFGFPLEMTIELAREHEIAVDEKGFYEEFNKHQELSRTASAGKFAGGLADHSEMTTKYHTATHLLHAALRKVLGDHVEQKGSNLTAERLRFDFSHPDKMTDTEIKDVEDLVNNAITHDYNVSSEEMSVTDAREGGAMGLFGDKYGEKVKVYSIGDPEQQPNAANDSDTFSKEICGGPHVTHTGDMGHFKIQKEQSVSAGVRRIKAILE